MSKVVRFHRIGGPEVLQIDDVDVRAPKESGSLRPLIAKVFPLSQIADAHRFMESNAQIGKIVIKI